MQGRSGRWVVIVAAIPLAVLAGIVLPQVLASGRLPDTLAVHWGAGGSPNGSMPAGVSLLVLAGSWILFWGLLAVGSSRSLPASPVVAFTYFAGGLLVVVQAWIVVRNLDAVVWTDAGDLSWPGALSAVGAGLALGGAGWALAGGAGGIRAGMRPGREGPAPSGLGPGEVGAWAAITTNRSMLALAVGLLAAVVFVPAAVRVVLVPVAILVATFATVRVEVSSRGVVVGFGPAGWPRQRVPLEAIDRAGVPPSQPAW